MTLLLVMLGAGLGAPSRWLLDQAVQARWARVFPLGTFTINVTGSALLGVVYGLGSHGVVGATVLALVATGFCGGFTTWSTFGYETVRLGAEGARVQALLNVVLSLAVGLAAFWLGWTLTT